MGETSFSHLYRLVLSIQGVAIIAAPMLLYEAGKGWFDKYEYLAAALGFATIWLVGFFYVLLGQLRNGKP